MPINMPNCREKPTHEPESDRCFEYSKTQEKQRNKNCSTKKQGKWSKRIAGILTKVGNEIYDATRANHTKVTFWFYR